MLCNVTLDVRINWPFTWRCQMPFVCVLEKKKGAHPAACNNGFPAVLTDINIELMLFDRNDVY